MNSIAEDILMHYGTPRHSGRYPWGSGDNPYQRSGDFLSRIEELKSQGLTETEIAKAMGMSTTQYRAQKSLAKDERRALDVARAKSLREDGLSLNEIAREMGFANDSSVRSLLNERSEARMNQAKKTAEFLKEQIAEKGMIDVGTGVERELGISKEKLKEALAILEAEGYPVYGGRIQQATNPGKHTTLQVVCPPGTEHKEIYDYDNIHSVKDYISYDDGESFRKSFVYPESMDSSRLKIRYAEDGGIDKDGVIEIRRGVEDLSLGESHYAQVRILVDGNRYLKGMAVYSDDLPDGVDVVFNTNKKQGTPTGDVLKKITNDPENPFGSLIKEHGGQSYYDDPNGKYTDPVTGKKQSLSLINKRAEEGDWGEWSDHLPSQFLSKQSMTLINKQLDLATKDKFAEFDEICSLTNPTVKKALLKSFADDCDSAAVHLQAAALPRQKYQVILPVTDMKDDEVYAPNYKNGEKVALIRYPHGGTFEIPILTVNNKQSTAKRMLDNALDAIGINSKVAERLSGADFDGDTVMVIPTGGKVKVTSTPPLKGLEGFDPKLEYGGKKEGTFKPMKNTQTEMGKISNLITDMTLKGATQDELARAVRHSMVVIDAEKHKLDYKQSERDNGISALKKKYQGTVDENGRYHEGAATLISRAKSETSVLKRKGSPIIDKETGEQRYKEVYEEYTDKNGKVKVRTQASTKMAETKDARTLSSGTPQEEAYADYANNMKSLANRARREMMNTGKIAYSASAKRTYQAEVDSLEAKLNVALKNAPRERQAQILANAAVKAKKQENPDMTKGEIKKANQQALTAARNSVGAKREPILITDREWEAIQAGAISENRLTQIINNVDTDKLRQRATPRATTTLSSAKVNKIASMNASGYTTAEIAEALGVSASTVSKYLN
ncbi:helix-turn-helix transcriptional regulator [Ruthenibacterium lactatiformans]|jgi:DNA-binding CsgD family transcriptional regulator|uniref:helix-turn-helix transcriptional regulator n=1 Tax=Ruthenibacterium lactatiformans TaxID=1550024 RepID=UPI0019686729|nr:helix-turn-helix domain-containing protein [Ruthenibacterium lactatiformans]MBN3012809.1 helix-turn-helix domain-containing protein [Ruthenibacterium lactatiformans]